MASSFEIVRASSADLEAVAQLFDAYRQFYEKPADQERARAFMAERLGNGDSIVFLARDVESGAALGFTQLYPSFSSVSAQRIWILNDLYVAPEARRGGVARALMQAAEAHARETGAKRLTLSTAHTNAQAQRLYETLGYQQDTDYRHYDLEL